LLLYHIKRFSSIFNTANWKSIQNIVDNAEANHFRSYKLITIELTLNYVVKSQI